MDAVTEAARHKELDLIQDIVKRMAANSFQVKTWMMSIVTAILAFKNEEIFSGGKHCAHTGLWISVVLLFPVIMFWYLDAFFLKTERLYRLVYQWVIANRPFTEKYLYDLNTFRREDFANSQNPASDMQSKVVGIGKTMLSKTLFWFYMIPMLIVIMLVIYNIVS